jgi:hypothetical protein
VVIDERPDAVFLGGPLDGDEFAASGAGVVTVPDGKIVHRYVCTSATHDEDGRVLIVYAYMGEKLLFD